METITYPSPSAFLQSPILPPPVTLIDRQTATKNKSPSSTVGKLPTAKPKQSKSRNGCVTCKSKRLKCDETKPTCLQCHKRNVECGGYKKDFKWRSFEEATFTSKPASSRNRKSLLPLKTESQVPESPCVSDGSGSTIIPPFPRESKYCSTGNFSSTATETHSSQSLAPSASSSFNAATPPAFLGSDQYVSSPALYQDMFPLRATSSTVGSNFDHAIVQTTNTTATSSSSGQSPRLIDLLIPGTDLNAPPQDYIEYRPLISDTPYVPSGHLPLDEDAFELDDEVEEILRQPDLAAEAWVMRLPSPSPSASSSSSSSESLHFDPWNYIYSQPKLHSSSPEMLMLGFDRQTCGILSVKDGPTENPWRTLVWPLARDSPALYHAISSMTAFHTSKLKPWMKVEGIGHMRRSIQHLASGIENMRIETALATTLALAFSESWDVHVSTGFRHLQGAKALINKALTRHQQSPLQSEELVRLKFLYNTWIYMDVIARLTNANEDESNASETGLWPSFEPFGTTMEVDPLMGCASTLFPLIGRVANLVHKVRKSTSNSINIISQANELKSLVEMWEPPTFFEAPEDPTSEIQDGLQTAEAYRWATLLYLHQAVPEIPSLTAAQLSNKVLIYLATVPPSSRTIIVHIYPLLAAGCEAESAEDRAWVEERWRLMTKRMLIGNIDRCLEVVKEVWDRRDAQEAEKLERQYRRAASRMSSYMGSPVQTMKRAFSVDESTDMAVFDWANSAKHTKRRATEGDFGMPVPIRLNRTSKCANDSTENIDFDKTVRGRLHWVGVMKDWCWEVLLG